ncbi:MAG: IS30 family transposase, partial [Lentisphaerae bacterium]|nr:IS30 family transposase [Lentisphaerota bacterium]
LTLDNGKEFAFHQKIERETGALVYFAHPYHSWERGTNENTNGLVRRLHPKGSSFNGFGAPEETEIDSFLNDRPRKCLGWMTAREAMEEFLKESS